MADLVILSERNILGYLHDNGIYPKEFYTDLDELKKRAVIFNETRILVIFSGACGMSRKKVLDFVEQMKERIANEKDKGIVSIDVMSDTILNGYKGYYYYTDSLFGYLDVYNGKTKIGEYDDFWDEWEYKAYPEAKTYLRDRKSEIRAEFVDYKKGIESEKDLRRMIKIPKIKFKKPA